MSENWDKRFINQAFTIAEWSKDPSSKVGSVLVYDFNIIATGYNGFPRKVEDSLDRLTNRSVKYAIVVHSETNCIAAAAKVGVSTDGSTLYCTHHCCAKCTGMIINAGIRRVVISGKYINDDFKTRWKDDIDLSEMMFRESGIILDIVGV